MSKEYLAVFYRYTLVADGVDGLIPDSVEFDDSIEAEGFYGDVDDKTEVLQFVKNTLGEVQVPWSSIYIEKTDNNSYTICRVGDDAPIYDIEFSEV